MDGLSKKLTEKDVTEALSQRKELLECYRQRHAMLSKEYEDSGELIEMLQMRSSRNDFGNNKGGFAHGLDDIYLLYEKQKKNYQKEIYKNMRKCTEAETLRICGWYMKRTRTDLITLHRIIFWNLRCGFIIWNILRR